VNYFRTITSISRVSLAFKVGAADTLGARVASGTHVARRPLLTAAGIGGMSVMLLAGACNSASASPISHPGRAVADDSVAFEALAMVESGGRDGAIGPAGEVSRYQIMPSVWRQYTSWPISKATNPAIALVVARAVMAARLPRLAADGEKSGEDWYLLWHRPARVRHPRGEELARAQRFENLLLALKNHEK